MRFAVFGAGGIGGYLGGRLAQSGEDVAINARGDHLTSIRDHGLRVDSIKHQWRLCVQAFDRYRCQSTPSSSTACYPKKSKRGVNWSFLFSRNRRKEEVANAKDYCGLYELGVIIQVAKQ